jgi:hypothetical protein
MIGFGMMDAGLHGDGSRGKSVKLFSEYMSMLQKYQKNGFKNLILRLLKRHLQNQGLLQILWWFHMLVTRNILNKIAMGFVYSCPTASNRHHFLQE